MSNKLYTTRRFAIAEALTEKIKENSSQFSSDIAQNVFPRMKFFDDISEYPTICLSAGTETRQYQAGQYKDRFLNITIRIFVNSEDPVQELEGLLADLEFVIEENGRLAYTDRSGALQTTHDILIASIDTDEGLLAPLGIGDLLIQVRY